LIENVKAIYLIIRLQISKYISWRLEYVVAKENLILKNLWNNLLLPSIEPCNNSAPKATKKKKNRTRGRTFILVRQME